jgi:hypothetical protein
VLLCQGCAPYGVVNLWTPYWLKQDDVGLGLYAVCRDLGTHSVPSVGLDRCRV